MDSATEMPLGPLLAYYGDDFTGSTDAMEALAAAGVPTVLYLEPPTAEMLALFPDVRCIGLAGSSRGRTTDWMSTELPAAFASLAAFGAPILQYKVCSTFDSSKVTGSIGCAIDLGVKHMPGVWSPTIVGAPRLKRYQVFGHLFASIGHVGYRLDRHPTMARHPVTPMDESDLRLHLGKQTERRIELIDMIRLRQGNADTHQQTLEATDVPVVLIDVLDEETLQEAGRLVWERKGQGVFTASSSGLEYALTSYWRKLGWLPEQASLPQADPVESIAVVSGSCSPDTAAQIRWARANGFHTERLDISQALNPGSADAEIERCVDIAMACLTKGISPVIFSAEGPDDPFVANFDAIASECHLARSDAARRVGATLAEVMRRLLDRTQLKRIVVAGGDSSGEVVSTLGIYALSVVGGMAPGAPLCRAWSKLAQRNGLEIVLKGGQIGADSFFGSVKAGRLLP